MTETHHLPNFEAAKVLIYGDLMLDRYWYGQASRISPEAPVPVVHIHKTQHRPGGAANVALNISSLGGKTRLFGIVGNDLEGQELKTQLEKNQVKCHFQSVAEYPTTTKLRVIGQNQQLIRMDFEKNYSEINCSELITQYEQHLLDSSVVVLSDYAKGTLTPHSSHLIHLAIAAGIPVLVDPKNTDFNHYRGATLLTPNLKEFEAVVGHCPDQPTLEIKARKLMAQFAFNALLVTQGKDGMTLVTADSCLHIPAHAHEVFDVTGAGDTVIALIAAAIAVGESLETAVRLANLAAGIVVTKLGASTVSVAELRRAAQRRGHWHDGVVTEAELLTLVADARAHGETIVMTNGCFDILHHGHIEYLSKTKALGKRLIVAVNDDASVCRLKGEPRPFNTLVDRMAVLSALRVVDWIVPFSEDTPARLIAAVTPDILVKGGDYLPEQIAGGEHVIASGGQVFVIPFKSGFSTSALINKVQKNYSQLETQEEMI